MDSATFDVRAAAGLDHSHLHTFQTGHGLEEHDIVDFDCGYGAPAGNVIASVVDFAHFAETLLAGGGTMLTPATIGAMLTGHVESLGTIDDVLFGENASYGFGLETHRNYKGVSVVEHGGAYIGSFSAFWMVPSRKFAAVCLSNGEGAPSEYCAKAADLFLDLPDTPPAVHPPDVATLARWAGTYVDPSGSLGTVTATMGQEGLSIGIPAWQVDGPAIVMGGSELAVPLGTGGALYFSFFPTDGTQPKFLVSRSGVAARR
jgi:CubicO group peptidase (beta-lactamase class C family)